MGTIVIVILILLLIGALWTWGYSKSWGAYPSGAIGLVLLIVIKGCRTGGAAVQFAPSFEKPG